MRVKSVPIFILIVFTFSCAVKEKDQIIIPVIGTSFYDQALDQINLDLKNDKTNAQLIEQKIYYCDYLNWPRGCVDALNEYKRQNGMSQTLLDQYIKYYSTHEQFEELLTVLDSWKSTFPVGEVYLKEEIRAYTSMGRKNVGFKLLRNYLSKNDTFEGWVFASDRYLELQDTLMAAYALGKVYKEDSLHQLISDHYGYILVDLGHKDIGLELLEDVARRDSTNLNLNFSISLLAEENDRLDIARSSIQSHLDEDMIAFRVANLYKQELLWDSAHNIMNQVIDRDSLNTSAWFLKAQLYEDRGWLSQSLNYYNHVLYLSPEDSITQDRIQSVRRKIAYLQRLKFEENKLPLQELKSKKIIQ